MYPVVNLGVLRYFVSLVLIVPQCNLLIIDEFIVFFYKCKKKKARATNFFVVVVVLLAFKETIGIIDSTCSSVALPFFFLNSYPGLVRILMEVGQKEKNC